jgi:hypothetical protein
MLRHRFVVLALACALLASCGLSVEPTNVEVSVEAPTSVRQGDRFQIRARIRNTAPNVQHLVDLDIADEYLEGVVIEKTEPAFKNATHVSFDNTMSYKLELPVPSGEERVVVLHAYAAHRGDYSGEFDFCVNSVYEFVSYPARTIIQ